MGRPLLGKGDLTNTFVNERATVLLPKFEALAPFTISERKKGPSKGNSKIKGWHMLAIEESVIFKRQYPDDNPNESEKTYRSAWRQIKPLEKELNRLARKNVGDPRHYHPVLTIIKHFTAGLTAQFLSYKVQSNIEYRQRVAERSDVSNRTTINLTKYLEYANTVLNQVVSGEKPKWSDVSCAVALASGRRMSEVHLSAEFITTDEYELEFTGQLKGKTRVVGEELLIDAVFRIPTLVKAELVKGGLDYLQTEGKRFSKSEDVERFNRRFSKDLSHCVKENWDFLGNRETTYHKFRGAYFAANAHANQYTFEDYPIFARKIMGDDDISSIRTYVRYKIDSDSKTRI
jgi:hypothetical protein